MRLRVAILITLVVALAAAPSALAAQPVAKPSYLFALTSTGGTLKHDASGWWVTLTGVSPMVTRFTDRPGRQAATMTPTQLANRWQAYGFTKDAPNAALVLDARPANSDVYVIELRNPRVDGNAMLFRAKPIRTTTRALRHYVKRADPLREMAFGRASLFIDDGGYATYQPLTLMVQGFTPGQNLAINVTGVSGYPVTFTMGPPWSNSTGFQLQTPGISIAYLSANGTTLRLNSLASGGGGTTPLTISVYLTAPEGVQSFSLSSTSDPGITVTAESQSPDGPDIEMLSQTPTLFFWAD
jgi:hypothetical protein